MTMHYILEAIIFILDMNMIFIKTLLKWILPKSYKSIKGEVCLITGAGRGIGRLLAIEIAKKGASVVLWDVNVTGNNETARMVRDAGGIAYTDEVDVSKSQDVYEAAIRASKTAGNITILVNNAGIVFGRDFFDLTDSDVLKTFNVNTLAHFWTCRAFLPKMMETNHGHIVTIASTLGFMSAPGVTDYVSSKHAVVGFHNSLTFDLLRRKKPGIKTTLVCPHIIKTKIFDGITPQRYPPPLDPDECVQTIMDAILTDKAHVSLPRFMYFLHNMTTWLPHEAMVRAQYHYGTFDLMEDVGRVKKEQF